LCVERNTFSQNAPASDRRAERKVASPQRPQIRYSGNQGEEHGKNTEEGPTDVEIVDYH
jgi:hypothetical protein